MMSKVIYVAITVAITLVVLLPGSYCFNETECGTFTTDCCDKDGCIHISCTGIVPNTTYDRCHSNTTDLVKAGVCSNASINLCETAVPTTVAPLTVASTTMDPAPSDSCASQSMKEPCCAVAGCKFVACNQTDPNAAAPGCLANTTDLSADCVPVTVVDACVASTTPAPTTPAPTCDGYNETTCCNHTDVCQYVQCTDVTSNTEVKACYVNTDTLDVCETETVKPLCNADVTTQAPPSSTENTAGDQNANTGGNVAKQHFDGPSFIGGIVLCAGIVAIAFVGHKFYKARTERNYHTL